jgi:hypothetical protein
VEETEESLIIQGCTELRVMKVLCAMRVGDSIVDHQLMLDV